MTLNWTTSASASMNNTGSSGVTVDGQVELTVVEGSGYVTFTGVIVQQNVLSLGASQNDGLIVAVCLYDGPGNG